MLSPKNVKRGEKNRPGTRVHVLWREWLKLDAVVGLLLILLVALVSVFGYHMRFIKLRVSPQPVLNILTMLWVLPVLVAVFGLYARDSRRPNAYRLLRMTAIPVLLAAVASTCFFMLVPPFCSSTGSLRHYGQFDSGLSSGVEDELTALLPEKSVAEQYAGNYRYYKYSSFLEDDLYLTMGITLPETLYEQEKARLAGLELLSGADWEKAEGIELIEQHTPTDAGIHITLDEVYHRIIYSYSFVQRR